MSPQVQELLTKAMDLSPGERAELSDLLIETLDASDDPEIWKRVKEITPANDRLLRLASRMPPPDSWYEEDY